MEKIVYGRNMSPKERREYIEKHADYSCSFDRDLECGQAEYRITLQFLSDRSIPKARSCIEGYFG